MSYPPSTKPAALAIFFSKERRIIFSISILQTTSFLILFKDNHHDQHVQKTCFLCRGHVIICICNNQVVMRLCSSRKSMQNLKSKIFNDTKFIQFLKQVRWHFCQVYIYVILFNISSKLAHYYGP